MARSHTKQLAPRPGSGLARVVAQDVLRRRDPRRWLTSAGIRVVVNTTSGYRAAADTRHPWREWKTLANLIRQGKVRREGEVLYY